MVIHLLDAEYAYPREVATDEHNTASLGAALGGYTPCYREIRNRKPQSYIMLNSLKNLLSTDLKDKRTHTRQYIQVFKIATR